MTPDGSHETLAFNGDDSKPLMTRSSWSGDEEDQLHRLQKKPTGSKRTRQVCSIILSLRHALNTVLLLAILAFLVTSRYGDGRGRLESSGDITGFAPTIRRQIRTFAYDSSFTPDDPADWFTNRVRQKWLDLVPKGLGYVRVDNPEDYDNLPTPLPEYDVPVFTTSVTHQLHCLYKLEELFSSLVSNNTGSRAHDDSADWHSSHCFEYLRQSIVCCGDTTLEGKQTSFPDKTLPGSDGWDAKHICRDWDQVRSYLEKNRVNDKVWI
ncbi:hypothetical protein NA57DRAFT_71895 [Rhizodiscina lignyota]|uniref:Oxidase ustYa n=1 Tax=Rhizodiscina lignyota TaxID=1504668 RepID=A0A9P4MA63_9PEZI|nr:hypothetical protein NA57DRAFT_71895 [Rhizodiscina lignyota]